MRPTNFLGLLASVFGLLYAFFFLERYMGFVPCPLCILDRFALAACGVLFFLGLFVEAAKPRWILLGLNVASISSGIVFASRHVWLQNQPIDLTRPCLSEQEAIAGFIELIKGAFNAEADCALIGWEFMGLSIPAQTLIFFIGILALLAVQGYGIYLDQLEREGGDRDD